MKHFKFKKIKIAKINNLNMILGGNDRETVVQGCIPDTETCPPEKTRDPNDTDCHQTDFTLTGDVTGIAVTEECNG
jgi:hypothetical protein